MKTTEKYLEAFQEVVSDLKTDLRMLEGYSRFVDESTSDYHKRLVGYISQHIDECEMLVGILEDCIERKKNEVLKVS